MSTGNETYIVKSLRNCHEYALTFWTNAGIYCRHPTLLLLNRIPYTRVQLNQRKKYFHVQLILATYWQKKKTKKKYPNKIFGKSKELTRLIFNDGGVSGAECASFFTWTSLHRPRFTTYTSFNDLLPLDSVQPWICKKIKSILGKFAIKNGISICSIASALCSANGWISSNFHGAVICQSLSYWQKKNLLRTSILVDGSNANTSPSITCLKQVTHDTVLPIEKHSLIPVIFTIANFAITLLYNK